MELLIYVCYSVDVCFVGYLLVDCFLMVGDCVGVCDVFGLLYDVLVLVVLLGSCGLEIEWLGVIFFDVVVCVVVVIFGLWVVVFVVNVCVWVQVQVLLVQVGCYWLVLLQLIDGQVYEVMFVVDVVLFVFGIVMLEVMLVKWLMVVGYCVLLVSYCIVWWLCMFKIDIYLLFNVLVCVNGLDCLLFVVECMQDDCIVVYLVDDMLVLFNDSEWCGQIVVIFEVLYCVFCVDLYGYVGDVVVDVVVELLEWFDVW